MVGPEGSGDAVKSGGAGSHRKSLEVGLDCTRRRSEGGLERREEKDGDGGPDKSRKIQRRGRLGTVGRGGDPNAQHRRRRKESAEGERG